MYGVQSQYLKTTQNFKAQLHTLRVNVFQRPTTTLRNTSTDSCVLNNMPLHGD